MEKEEIERKRTKDCGRRKGNTFLNASCPNYKEIGGGMDGEIYKCEVCGEYTHLYYDDMR